ncbi:MAG: hypothetical protein QOI10_2990 [Solirubrobacterales bacterium]|nr:hypothetical protein [Solirubrobacterales bacterium]
MNTVDSAPAGGAAIGQVIGASAAAMLATAALLYLGWAHRTGRTNLLRRAADLAARDTGFAPWAALPSLIAAGALLVALLGMYWDISLHIDNGRDPGPLANPAHYLILAGLFGIFAAGFLAIVLPDGKPSGRAIRIAGDWYAPLGGVAMLAASAFALIGFPLDDVWHRIFGQDVTLWGPTHLMLIGGAALTLIGSAILIVEGRGEEVSDGSSKRLADRVVARLARGRRFFAMGGLLIGLSTFQAEFDFGVPQFQLVLEPIMLAFAAGVALVAARIWIGRGAALGAALFFIVVRGTIALIVGDVFGETMPHLPLYLVEALCVEGVALLVSTRRIYAFGAISGALIGTVGFFAEYAWSHIWMPIPWPQSLIAEAWLPALVAGVAAGILGGYLGGSFAAAAPRRVPFPAPATIPAALATLAIVAVVGLNVGDQTPSGWSARVSLDNVKTGAERTVNATVRLDPPQIADDAYWLQAISWQGGGLVVDQLRRVSPGVYETTKPLPAHGTWKTLIRLQRDNYVAGLPVYMPEDSAIPAPAIKARPSFQRPFVDETQILQRELKSGVPGYLAGLAYSIVAAIVLGLVLLLGWVLNRIARPDDGGPRRGVSAAAPRTRPRQVPA